MALKGSQKTYVNNQVTKYTK